MACDEERIETWMDLWRVSQHLVFPLIQTLSGKCYTTIFPLVGLALSLAVMSLWLHFQEGLWMKQMVPHRTKSLSLFCILLDCPCRWKVKASSVKDVLKLVSVLICLLARGPEWGKGRTRYCVTQNRLFSHHRERGHVLAGIQLWPGV